VGGGVGWGVGGGWDYRQIRVEVTRGSKRKLEFHSVFYL